MFYDFFGGLVLGYIKTKSSWENTRLSEFFKIYKMCTLMHRSKLKTCTSFSFFRTILVNQTRFLILIACGFWLAWMLVAASFDEFEFEFKWNKFYDVCTYYEIQIEFNLNLISCHCSCSRETKIFSSEKFCTRYSGFSFQKPIDVNFNTFCIFIQFIHTQCINSSLNEKNMHHLTSLEVSPTKLRKSNQNHFA